MIQKQYIFSLEFAVRDYECDLQGIVNNANYQYYLEHARHEFLISRGIDFASLHQEGLDLIVTRIEIDYKFPLKSRDKFIVKLNLLREGNLRLVFEQDIFIQPGEKHIVQAKVTGIAIRNGRPVVSHHILNLLGLE
jgi:acyl-CoA thioester hydrolase